MDILAGFVRIVGGSLMETNFYNFIYTLAVVIAAVGLIWRIADSMKKSCDNKISRIYQRFDEYKAHLERTHISREVHDIKYGELKETTDEIKADVKLL